MNQETAREELLRNATAGELTEEHALLDGSSTRMRSAYVLEPWKTGTPVRRSSWRQRRGAASPL